MRFLRALGGMVMILFIATALVFASPPAMASGKNMKAIYQVSVHVTGSAAPTMAIDTSPAGGAGTTFIYAVDKRGDHAALKEAPDWARWVAGGKDRQLGATYRI